MNHPNPVIGQWYKSPEVPAQFEVVAVDEDLNAIEIQYFDGEIGEIDMDIWMILPLEELPEPEDWHGPYEIAKEDVQELTEEPFHPEDWVGPVNKIEPE